MAAGKTCGGVDIKPKSKGWIVTGGIHSFYRSVQKQLQQKPRKLVLFYAGINLPPLVSIQPIDRGKTFAVSKQSSRTNKSNEQT